MPVEIGEAEIVVLPDGPTEAVLRRQGIPFRADVRGFTPAVGSTRAMPVRSAGFDVTRVG